MLGRLTFRSCWAWVLLLALALVAALGSSGRIHATASVPFGVTYTGPASAGGTVTVALSGDQSTVLWIALKNVYFPQACLSHSVSGTWYASPPTTMVGGAFDNYFPEFHAQTIVHGQVDSGSSISGTAYWTTTYPFQCPTQTITWTATAAGPTPPGKLDRQYSGPLGTGTMDIWTGAGGTITAIDIDSVDESPCTDGWGPLTVRGTFNPPPAIQGSYVQLAFTPIWAGVSVEASRPDLDTLETTVTLIVVYVNPPCVLSWTGNLASIDTDSDGCIDFAEQQVSPGSQASGGLRDPQDPNDYFNPSHDGQNRVDDILLVAGQYFIDAGNPAYNPDTDRTLNGPNAWNSGPPDGQQRVDDILTAIKQYFHDCA